MLFTRSFKRDEKEIVKERNIQCSYKKGKKREREGNQNKSRLELYAESWSGKTEQIKVKGNKILLINRNREERDIKTWRLMQKKAAQDSDYRKMQGKGGLGNVQNSLEKEKISQT